MSSSLTSHSFPSIKPLLLCFLSLACFLITTIHASSSSRSSNTEGHFHTIEIGSLLPASTCNYGTKGASKRLSTLQVTHRHGPCSHDNPTTTSSLEDILSHDQSRVDHIQARAKPDPNLRHTTSTTNPSRKSIAGKKNANIPSQSGRPLGTGNYIVTVGLGTPKKSLSLVFDTGSDLTWTQCEPCVKSCYKQQEPIFNPSLSSTYLNVTCSSSQCSLLSSATGNSPGCSSSTGTCIYGIQYGDQSFSVGFFSRDKLTLTSTDVFPSFFFGCGQNNQGLFGNTAGLLGLGRNPLSIVSQTAQRYGKYFSYCLPSTSSSTGHLTLGSGGASSNGVKFTPFSSSQGNSFYFVDIVSIYVGGRLLPIGQSVFSSAGSIIDSGTVITRLPPQAYDALSGAFRQLMKKYPTSPGVSILDTCFDFSGYTTVTIPTVSFVFGGNVKVDLHPNGILVAISSAKACLAFAGNSGATDVGIFGNTQQKTLEVVYDVAGSKLGFGAGGCN